MSRNPRSQTNRSGSSRSRNWPITLISRASWLSMNSRSKRSMRTSRLPGCRVYWRSSTIGDQLVSGAGADGKSSAACMVGLPSSFAREVIHPVGLPGLLTVDRERLLPMCCGRRDVRPQKAHANRLSLVGVVTEEATDTLREATDHWSVDEWVTGADPVQRPFLAFGTEQT